jgi:hypothetical protein
MTMTRVAAVAQFRPTQTRCESHATACAFETLDELCRLSSPLLDQVQFRRQDDEEDESIHASNAF